jgi:hypothetical protein
MHVTAARPLTLFQGSWVQTTHTFKLHTCLAVDLYIHSGPLPQLLRSSLPDLEACLEDLQGLVRLFRPEMQQTQLHATVSHLPSRTARQMESRDESSFCQLSSSLGSTNGGGGGMCELTSASSCACGSLRVLPSSSTLLSSSILLRRSGLASSCRHEASEWEMWQVSREAVARAGGVMARACLPRLWKGRSGCTG